jgi:hypothetical protein
MVLPLIAIKTIVTSMGEIFPKIDVENIAESLKGI